MICRSRSASHILFRSSEAVDGLNRYHVSAFHWLNTASKTAKVCQLDGSLIKKEFHTLALCRVRWHRYVRQQVRDICWEERLSQTAHRIDTIDYLFRNQSVYNSISESIPAQFNQ